MHNATKMTFFDFFFIEFIKELNKVFFQMLSIIKYMIFFTLSYSNNVFPPPLSLDEEKVMIERLKKKDKEARNILIERNLRLVAHIVKKFESKSVSQDDLISIGTIGLIKGIDSYSNSKSTKITTYAARCIENEILMYFRSNKKRGCDVSLNDSIGYDKDGNEINLIDVLKDNTKDFAEIIHTKDNISLLNRYLDLLNKREKEIIIKRYGLCNTKEQTQKEIAHDLKISRSYVSRIEKRALTKMLKEFINDKKDL